MPMNRREALIRLGGLITAGWATSRATAQSATTTTSVATATTSSASSAAVAQGKSFSVAHITDVHLFDKYDSEKWFAKCLHAIQSHESRPVAILNTGDSVMDVLKTDRARTDQLWSMWERVTKNELSLPMHSVLGNHDCWGYGRGPKDSSVEDPEYGKVIALQQFGLKKPYESFDYGDWHFIGLDSIQPAVGKLEIGWEPRLDDEQFQWLEADLAANSTRPVCIYSHISILQVATMNFLKPNDNGVYAFGRHSMMNDADRLIALFDKHRNVKLCLSGHIHLRDRVELNGVTYICDGAVSGGWWKGPRRDVEAGYSIVTFNPNGTFDLAYNGYGWEANEELKAEQAKS